MEKILKTKEPNTYYFYDKETEYVKKDITAEIGPDQTNKATADNGIIKSSSEAPVVKTKSHKRIIAAVVGLIVVAIPLIIFLSTRNENDKVILSSSSDNESAVNTTVPMETITTTTASSSEPDIKTTTTSATEAETTTTTKATTTAATTTAPIRMDNGLLIVDQKLFGMSHNDAEAYLGKSLGAPIDFPWWSVHLTLYVYDANGYYISVFFNDSDELAIIGFDQKKDFDKSIVDKFTAKFGNPSSYGENCYSFNAGSELSLNVDMDIYLDTNEWYFRQQYVSSKYYY